MEYENITIAVSSRAKSRMQAMAKECSLELETWLGEMMEYLSAEDFRNEEEAFEAAMEKLRTRKTSEAAEGLNRLLEKSPPVRVLAPGQTIEDVIGQEWSGQESDEEVQSALRELS